MTGFIRSLVRPLDRWFLLNHPVLWSTRIHLVTVLGIPAAVLLGALGLLIPIRPDVNYSNEINPGPHVAFFVIVLVGTTVATLYWAYLRVRSNRLLPFGARLWLFPAYLYGVLVMNAGAFIMSYVYALRAQASPYPIARYDYIPIWAADDGQIPLLFAILLEIAVFVSIARGVRFKILIWSLVAMLAATVGLAFILASTWELKNTVVIGSMLLFGVIGLMALVPAHPRFARATAMATSVFHLFVPFAVWVFVALGVREDTERLWGPTLAVLIVYLFASILLESRLTRLRSLPQ